MKLKTCYPVRVLATGFVVLTLLSIPLFLFRFVCEISLAGRMPIDASYVKISTSGLVPPELENDPNVVSHSYVSASMNTEEPLFLGIIDYFEAIVPGGRQSNIYHFKLDDKAWVWIYFDKRIGQISCRYNTILITMPDKTAHPKEVQLYVGPEGVSETADKSLGKFIDPIADSAHWEWPSSLKQTLYDRKLRRFFTIDFDKKTVFKGPQLTKDDKHKPIQIGLLKKNSHFVNIDWSAHQIKVAEDEKEKGRYLSPSTKPLPGTNYARGSGPYLLVLDETGRIDLLDRETLEFAGPAGRLPVPQTLFSSKQSVTDKDLLGYRAFGLTSTNNRKYLGMCAASLNRDGTAMTAAVFDEKGKQIRTRCTMLKQDNNYIPSNLAVYSEAPWAPASTIGKYLVENLHPPILSIASFFMADSFEATSGHRALFILPNSFAAMKGRKSDSLIASIKGPDKSENIGTRLYAALLILLPSIILAILFAWRVSKDAATVGLSEKAKLYWMLGTLAFGLTAYITYRLARPKITLVTCVNCGNLRRPDMDRCHRCGSTWRVPELTPPAWRVIDN
jgi:hypothetical protein